MTQDRNGAEPESPAGEAGADGGDDAGDGHGGNGFALDDVHGSPDATLGGYLRTHDRPPAFEGADGQPYTVSPEVEKTGNLPAPYEGYLVFPRWAATGLGVVGHVETPTLVTARTRDEAEGALRELPLVHLKVLLDEAIEARQEGDA
jgi:hypothetical protein